MEDTVEKALKAAGFGAKLITAAIVIGGAFFIYRTYLDTILVRMQIEELKDGKKASV
jgi:hypothetical protein